MLVRDRDYYLHLRREYEPENVRLVIVAESPPASGKYFYDTTGSPKEPLFAAIMLQLGLSPITKQIGLQALTDGSVSQRVLPVVPRKPRRMFWRHSAFLPAITKPTTG